MEDFKLNDRVIVIGKNTKGKIAFIGETHFSKGKMFGVVLDEPKGKYSGTIDNMCYFKCPKNRATFVRACQLQKDNKCSLEDRSAPAYPNYLKDSSSKHGLKTIQKSSSRTEIRNPPKTKREPVKSPKFVQLEKLKDEKYQKDDATMNEADMINNIFSVQKDANCFSEDWIASTFQNNLKESSFKHELKLIQENTSKSEILNWPTTNTKQVKLPKLDQPEKLQYENRQEDKTTTKEVGKIKNNLTGNYEVKIQCIDEALAEFNDIKQNLTDANKKMDAVDGYLRNLKNYLKWNKGIKKDSHNGDHGIDNFFKLLVDTAMKKMEDIVGQFSKTKKANLIDDGSAFTELNYFLHKYVDVLEKRNEVLTDNLMYAKSILKRASNRSYTKKKCKCIEIPKTSDEQVERRCKACLSKCLLFTDELEQEARIFLESDQVKNAKHRENSNKELELSEKIKRYMDSLLPNQDIPSHTESEINSTMKNGNDNITDQQQTLTSDKSGIQNLLKSFTETNVSLKYKSHTNNHDGASQSRKRSPRKSPVKTLFKNGKDHTKDLQEFISEIAFRVSVEINGKMPL